MVRPLYRFRTDKGSKLLQETNTFQAYVICFVEKDIVTKKAKPVVILKKAQQRRF